MGGFRPPEPFSKTDASCHGAALQRLWLVSLVRSSVLLRAGVYAGHGSWERPVNFRRDAIPQQQLGSHDTKVAFRAAWQRPLSSEKADVICST